MRKKWWCCFCCCRISQFCPWLTESLEISLLCFHADPLSNYWIYDTQFLSLLLYLISSKNKDNIKYKHCRRVVLNNIQKNLLCRLENCYFSVSSLEESESILFWCISVCIIANGRWITTTDLVSNKARDTIIHFHWRKQW